jgi:hypothetical protein
VLCFALSTARNSGRKATAPGTANPRLAACLPSLQGLVLALGLAFLLSAPQLWPTLQYLPLTARQGWTQAQFLGGSIGPSEALTWLVPGFFGWQTPTYHGAMGICLTSEYFGLLPWALAAGALAALWRGETRVRWMSALALAAFFFAQGRWTPFYQVFHHVPVLAGLRIWSRTLFLLTFGVCVLAAFGWDALRGPETRSAALRGARVFLCLALAAAAFAWGLAPNRAAADAPKLYTQGFTKEPLRTAADLAGMSRDSARTTLELSAALLVPLLLWSRRLNTRTALLMALAFHAFDQNSVVSRFVTYMDPRASVAEPRFLEPPPPVEGVEPWRIYDHDISFPNNGATLGYENLDGRESVPLQSRQRIAEAMVKRGPDWLSLLNERYFFSHSKPGSSDPGDAVTIYQNRATFPRAWLVGQSVKVSGDKEAYRLLADPRFHPRTEVALDVDAGLDGRPPRGGVVWLERGPQTFSLSVATDRATALVVSDFWYPSWRADVDGRETRVLKADGGLQAVLLGAGSHRVDFRFDPGLFYDALAACLTGLVALFGLYRREHA